MYGLTEAFRSTYLPPEEIDRRPTSIGKAIPECEVFAVKPDGQRAKPGEPGILVHRGPTVSLGYWNRPEDTAAVLRQHPFRPAAQGGEIVCYSGDLVVEDEEGFFSFVGRADAMIKSSGYRISPTEVEEVLMATGAFRQVAVIGLPDPLARTEGPCHRRAPEERTNHRGPRRPPDRLPSTAGIHGAAHDRTRRRASDDAERQARLPASGAAAE